MKRTTALVMALAMVLTLAACGGKNADQPSNNTPPVTQGTQDQPNNTPADNTQPSEPTDTTPDEPQGNPGVIPVGAVVLYDKEHYVMPDESGASSYATVTGKKISQSTISIEVATDNGSITMTFGDNAPMSEGLSVELDGNNQPGYDNWTAQSVAPGENSWADILRNNIHVFNDTDTEQAVPDCNIVCVRLNGGIPKIDGQLIETFDDILNLFGAPTAVSCQMFTTGTVNYIWQFEDFFLAVASGIETGDGETYFTDIENAGILDLICYKPSEAVNNALNNNSPYDVIRSDATEALTTLGLL